MQSGINLGNLLGSLYSSKTILMAWVELGQTRACLVGWSSLCSATLLPEACVYSPRLELKNYLKAAEVSRATITTVNVDTGLAPPLLHCESDRPQWFPNY